MKPTIPSITSRGPKRRSAVAAAMIATKTTSPATLCAARSAPRVTVVVATANMHSAVNARCRGWGSSLNAIDEIMLITTPSRQR